MTSSTHARDRFTIRAARPSRAGEPHRLLFAVRSAAASLVSPSSREHSRAVALGSAVMAAALLVLSWERLGNFSAGPYNVKLSVVLFALTLLLAIRLAVRRLLALLRVPGALRVLLVLAASIVVVFAARALFVDPISVGLAQVASVLSGAVCPALAVLAIVRSAADLRWALSWVVRGALLAGTFGLWQLVAFYTGLPQLVVYTGVGTSGIGGRIAAFNYEPAYFAYFMVLAAGAAMTIARIDRRPVPWRTVVFFGVVLGLANVRALVFLLPVVAVLLALDWRANRRTIARGAVVAVPIAVALTFAPVVVQWAFTAVDGPTAASASRQETPVGGRTVRAPGRTAGEHGQEVGDGADSADESRSIAAAPRVVPPTAVLDPQEQSSNAPRIAIYRATLAVDLKHPLLGVGPGGLRAALGGDRAPTAQSGQVVANNIWLQAASDGGAPLLLLEGAVVVVMALLGWRTRGTVLQPLAATWLATVAVGGMLTSYFFDIKVWAIAALLLAGAAALAGPTADRATRTGTRGAPPPLGGPAA